MSVKKIIKPIMQEPDMDKDCEYCKEPILKEAAYCPHCNSQHHLECWMDNEGCARNGCYCNMRNHEPEEKIPELSPEEDKYRCVDNVDHAVDAVATFTGSMLFALGLPYTIPLGAIGIWLFKDK